ncbi:hypothetical protein R1flu_022051 [Riccia fluitans]|uniref:RecQ-mediated genome instability protein 1 n=1 Tax=Riccia fluitans TaxID=41844 RepID=A0ABD1ZR31_9MARC
MAGGQSRHVVIDDSESDFEDMRVLNELNNSAPSRPQHILLSDDEDDCFTPPVQRPPQQVPVTCWCGFTSSIGGRSPCNGATRSFHFAAFQVDEIIDISNSSRDRYQEKSAGPGRVLQLSLTDGVQRVFGMEYRPIRALQVLSSVGFKVSSHACLALS